MLDFFYLNIFFFLWRNSPWGSGKNNVHNIADLGQALLWIQRKYLHFSVKTQQFGFKRTTQCPRSLASFFFISSDLHPSTCQVNSGEAWYVTQTLGIWFTPTFTSTFMVKQHTRDLVMANFPFFPTTIPSLYKSERSTSKTTSNLSKFSWLGEFFANRETFYSHKILICVFKMPKRRRSKQCDYWLEQIGL